MSMPSSSEAVATTALSLPPFSRSSAIESQLAGKTAVVREHGIFAQPLAQMVCDAFRKATRVHEHQGRPVGLNQGRQPVVNLLPHLVRCDRPELVVRHLDRKIHRAAMTVVDDRDRRPLIRSQEPRDGFDGPDGRRQADALRPRPA